MYAKILVPVDGSETSTRGLKEAIELAKSHGSQLRLVHIVNELILNAEQVLRITPVPVLLVRAADAVK